MPSKKRSLAEADHDAQVAPEPAKKSAKAGNKGKGKERRAAPARAKKSTAAALGGGEKPADSNSQAHAATAKANRSLRRVRECGLVRGKKPKIPSLESCKDDPAKLEAGRLQVFGDPFQYFAICRPPWDLSDADEKRAFNCDFGATCNCCDPAEDYPGHTFIISGRGLKNLNNMVEAAESWRPESVFIHSGYEGYEVVETLDNAVSFDMLWSPGSTDSCLSFGA